MLKVPDFDDVRIYFGPLPLDGDGWILVGTGRNGNGLLIGDQIAFTELFQDIQEALNFGEQVWIIVK